MKEEEQLDGQLISSEDKSERASDFELSSSRYRPETVTFTVEEGSRKFVESYTSVAPFPLPSAKSTQAGRKTLSLGQEQAR
jgi:hypothetical protein